MDGAISRGAKLHHPAKAAALVKDADGTIIGVRIVSLDSKKELTIPCTNLVLSMGPWTPQVLKDLFPSSSISLDISPLAGYSLVIRSPRYTLEHERNAHRGQSHAVYTTHPSSCGFSPEIFLREGGEIYIAGLNPTIKLPSRAEDTNRLFDAREMQKLKDVAVRLMGGLAEDTEEATNETTNFDDLEILREGLCFRPVSNTGVPTIGKIDNLSLGGGTRASPRGGVFIAAGHGPWGISLSLGTGKIISEMIKKQEPSVNATGLAITGKVSSS
jgi:glycine/D-amino acid oxidase-like deaminating enzyme